MPAAAPQRCTTPYGELHLVRYPRRNPEPLQAWCSADLLLLEAAAARGLCERLLCVNDDFGALTLAAPDGTAWLDSWLSAEALARNAQANERPYSVTSMPGLPSPDCSGVLIRIPKQLALLRWQLQLLAQHLPTGTPVLLAGMDKHLAPNTAEEIEAVLGATERHRGARRARVFSARVPANAECPDIPWRRFQCDYLPNSVHSLPGVFSGDSLDIGSRFLLDNLSQLRPAERCMDLACGNGVLGLAAAHQGLVGALVFCDESAMALASAKDNATRMDLSADTGFCWGDGSGAYEGEPVDSILCNPPFHLGHTVDEYAGRRLLQQAARQLKPGGQLLAVANRHLTYGPALQRSFTSVKQVAQNRKFTLWSAIR